VIPDSVTNIERSLFYCCSALRCVGLPKSITSIPSCTFADCRSLEKLTLPEGVTSIEAHAFDGCRALKSLEIPDGVTSIGDAAFMGCASLTEIVIPNGVEAISRSTFENCTSLKEVVIPESVVSVGLSAFKKCSSLEKITVDPRQIPLFKNDPVARIIAINHGIALWWRGELTENARLTLAKTVKDRLFALNPRLTEDPRLLGFVTEQGIITSENAKNYLKRCTNTECKVILLDYINNKGGGIDIDGLKL
jgi:hypothetical protein